MTSEILQLLTQALETLISGSSFDCIPPGFKDVHIYVWSLYEKAVKTLLYNTVLKWPARWVRNASVQLAAILHGEGPSVLPS